MKFLLLASLLIASIGQAQTITTLPIAGGWLCPDDSIDVAFIASGKFESYNAFKVQVSTDTFSSFETIATVPGTGSDTIRVFISRSIYESDHYRLRVVSTAPYVQGTDNGSDLILPEVHNFHMRGASSRLLPYDTVRFALMKSHKDYYNPDYTYSWNFGKDAYPASSNLHSPPAVYYLHPGKKIVTLDIGFSPTCTFREIGVVYVGDCFPKIPDSAQIIDPDTTYGRHTGHVWVRGGAKYAAYGGDTIYAEPGSIVQKAGIGMLYLKPGAEATGGRPDMVVYEEGASFEYADVSIRCPDLEFDYSEAPSPEDFASVSKELPQFSIKLSEERIELRSDAIIRDVQVYDVLGRLIHRQNDGSAFDLRDWIAGKYFIRVNFGNAVITKAILVE
jgi:hypothetical protein